MTLGYPMTTIGMVNGMIGGTILTLPLYALAAGYGYSVLVLTITGFFSFYSCYLCLLHLGDDKDLDYAILKHFSGSRAIKIFYDLVVFLNLLLILILYFILIVEQWQGLTSSHNIAIPICNAFGLFALVFVLKYFQFGASILAYGIISIIVYMMFLAWLIGTAPSGPNKLVGFGKGAIDMAAAMGQAYSIQTFFIPVLKKSKSSKKYVLLTLVAYLIGYGVYMYIAYTGSFGILNRILPPNITTPSTIQDYFGPNFWEVTVLQVLYLIHLYSASPQFLLVSKKRLFSAFNIRQTEKGKVPIPQIIYTIIFIVICFIISVLQVSIEAIIAVNGAVIGFFFIYFIPAALHFKCMYFCQKQKQKKQIEDNSLKNQPQQNPAEIEFASVYNRQTMELSVGIQISQQNKPERAATNINKPQEKIQNQLNNNLIDGKSDRSQLNDLEEKRRKSIEQFISNSRAFTCTYKKPTVGYQVLEVVLALIMFLMGVFIMVNGLISLATGAYKNT